MSVEQILHKVFRADSGQGPAVTTCLRALLLVIFSDVLSSVPGLVPPRSWMVLAPSNQPLGPRAASLKSVVLLPLMQ